jgi:hypothetical protein
MSVGDSGGLKLTASGVWELEILECTICYSQMRDVSRPLTTVDASGQSCAHNFCSECLRAYVATHGDRHAADCPICRRNIVGIQKNQLATALIGQFLRVHERFVDEQKRSLQIVSELRQQLADSRELESSATEVNNLLRRKLEQQKAKLSEKSKEIEALQEELRTSRLEAVSNRLQEIRNDPEPSSPPPQTPQPATVTLAPPASLETMNSSSLLLSSMVNRLWSWATTPPPPAAGGFARDLKARYEVHERRGSKKNSGLFRGTDRETNERVALKTIREAADVREVMLLTKMRHRSLVRCDGVAFGSGTVMCAVLTPYVETDLAFAVTAGAVRPAAAPLVVRQLLDALAYMHSADVVHGNVCPTSILVTPECQVLLAACSYAHSVRASSARAVPQRVAPLGWHTAPEAAVAVRTASDVFSVGAVALFLLLQQAPTEQQLQNCDESTSATAFCAALLKTEPAERPMARDAVNHPFIATTHALAAGDVDANVCPLTYELQDQCLIPFVNAYAPKLSQLIK